MHQWMLSKRFNQPKKVFSFLAVFLLIVNGVGPVTLSSAQISSELNLPQPGVMVTRSAAFEPAMMKGIIINPNNPLQFDFLIDIGQNRLKDEALKNESTKLIKYFLASLTVPEEELWVNLSPYEEDRIVPDSFGVTIMGRDLLAQDYILKQLTASLMYPELDLGSKFWLNVFEKVRDRFGTTDIPMNTFNKIWIVPEKAVVYEHENVAYIVESHLKVMLEEDYVALQESLNIEHFGLDSLPENNMKDVSSVASEVVREILIPEIENEVNQGENFANLRQIYNSMILASWYKIALNESLLGYVYVDQNKTKGIDLEDREAKYKIYDQYVKAFKKGVYDYIREDYGPIDQDLKNRKYISGGGNFTEIKNQVGKDIIESPDALSASQREEIDEAMSGTDPRLVIASSVFSEIPTGEGEEKVLAEVDRAVSVSQSVTVPSTDSAMKLPAQNVYKLFYDSFGAMGKSLNSTAPLANVPSIHVTPDAVNSFAGKFLTPTAQLLPVGQRRLNDTWGADQEPFGVTEVYFVPKGDTQKKMVGFQQELKARFGDKVYLVDSDKLHFTTQGLEQQWDNKVEGTKKSYALHPGLEKINPDSGAIREVREKARAIKTPAVDMQVAALNYNPQTGIFWELRPYTKESVDPIQQRRDSWNLPQPRPPHITAAYFTQPFTPEEEQQLRDLLDRYSRYENFGNISVDQVQVIAYEDFSFNAGYKVLETVKFEPPKDSVSEDRKDFETISTARLDTIGDDQLMRVSYTPITSAGLALPRVTVEKPKKEIVVGFQTLTGEVLVRNPEGENIYLQPEDVSSKVSEVRSVAGRDVVFEVTAAPITGGTKPPDAGSTATTKDTYGGINLNPEILDLQIKRDGNGIPLSLDQQPIENMNIDGFLPFIIRITPVTNLPFLLGITPNTPVSNELSLNLTSTE